MRVEVDRKPNSSGSTHILIVPSTGRGGVAISFGPEFSDPTTSWCWFTGRQPNELGRWEIAWEDDDLDEAELDGWYASFKEAAQLCAHLAD